MPDVLVPVPGNGPFRFGLNPLTAATSPAATPAPIPLPISLLNSPPDSLLFNPAPFSAPSLARALDSKMTFRTLSRSFGTDSEDGSLYRMSSLFFSAPEEEEEEGNDDVDDEEPGRRLLFPLFLSRKTCAGILSMCLSMVGMRITLSFLCFGLRLLLFRKG